MFAALKSQRLDLRAIMANDHECGAKEISLRANYRHYSSPLVIQKAQKKIFVVLLRWLALGVDRRLWTQRQIWTQVDKGSVVSQEAWRELGLDTSI